MDAGQLLENRRPAFRIVAGDDFSFRLVVEQDARQAGPASLQLHQPSVDANPIDSTNPLADVSGLTIDTDSTFGDPGLNLSPRSLAGISERLLQFDGWRLNGRPRRLSRNCRVSGSSLALGLGWRPQRTILPLRAARVGRFRALRIP
jgi:hypothetical protein